MYDIVIQTEQLFAHAGMTGQTLMLASRMAVALVVLGAACVIYLLCHRLIVPLMVRMAEKTVMEWDDILLNEKTLRRAGMDYWDKLDVTRYVDYEEFLQLNPGAKLYFATTKARRLYTEVSYEKDCYIMFGKESAGIPEEILVRHPDSCIRIPMLEETRSLNLSNSVAIILYEALRQHGFENLEKKGQLHHLRWS